MSGNNLCNINEKSKLPGNNQQSFVETSHICPFNRVTGQVDNGEMREVILRTYVSPLILSLVTLSSQDQENARRCMPHPRGGYHWCPVNPEVLNK